MCCPNLNQAGRPHTRAGSTSVWVLSAVVVVLAAIILFLLTRGAPTQKAGDGSDLPAQEDETPVVRVGEKASREELPKDVKLDKPVQALGKPDRIKETLEVGKTYKVVQKTCLESRGEDPDWGAKEVVKIGLVVELMYSRTIESNDGSKLVEVRHVESYQGVKLLAGGQDCSLQATLLEEPRLKIGFDCEKR